MQALAASVRKNQDLSNEAPMEAREKVTRILKETLLAAQAPVSLPAAGNSMIPLIQEGDILTVRPASPCEAAWPDLVVFESSGSLCCHRLIFKKGKGKNTTFLAKSDISLALDTPFGSDSFLGKVVRIQKKKAVLRLEAFPWNAINAALGTLHLCIALLRKALSFTRYRILKTPAHA